MTFPDRRLRSTGLQRKHDTIIAAVHTEVSHGNTENFALSYLSACHLCCTTMMQMHSDTEVMLNISSAFWRHWFQLARAWFSRRAAGAEAWVEIALSHKHPPEDPIKATHQRGCLYRVNQSSVALLLRPIIQGMQSQISSDNNFKKN